MLLDFGFKGPNIIIPVYLPVKDKMSYVVIEVRNVDEDTITEDFEEDVTYFLKKNAMLVERATREDNGVDPVPHIGIVMSPRGQEEYAGVEVIYPPVMSDTPPGLSETYNFHDLLAAVGLDLSIYPGLLHPKDTDDNHRDSFETIKILPKLLYCLHPEARSRYERSMMFPYFCF